MTRQRLRELMQAKVNAAKRLEAAGAANTHGAGLDQLVDIGREHAAASREYGQADLAFQNACQRFDEENTQEAVLSGAQPKGDAALLADFGDALPLDPERFDEATGPCDGKGD